MVPPLVLVSTHECSTIPKQVSRKDAKAQRKSLFFAPLRALREMSFSSNDGLTGIPERGGVCNPAANVSCEVTASEIPQKTFRTGLQIPSGYVTNPVRL